MRPVVDNKASPFDPGRSMRAAGCDEDAWAGMAPLLPSIDPAGCSLVPGRCR